MTPKDMLEADQCHNCEPMECSHDLRLRRSSLTRELDKGGCAYYYMNRVFPGLARFVRHLLLPKGDLLVDAPVRGLEGLSGTSFDRRLRYEYEPDYTDSVITGGLFILERRFGEESANSLRKGLESPDIDERALYAGVCDTAFRNAAQGPEAWNTLLQSGDALKRQLVEDIRALMAVAREQLPLSAPVFGPTFGPSSLWFGGADADLIDDGCVIDLKAAKTVKATEFIRQTLAYVLLDVDDDWKLDSVGVYLARHGILWKVPLAAAEEEAGLSISELRRNAPWGNPADRAALEQERSARYNSEGYAVL